jgi:hypothetical protein
VTAATLSVMSKPFTDTWTLFRTSFAIVVAPAFRR